MFCTLGFEEVLQTESQGDPPHGLHFFFEIFWVVETTMYTLEYAQPGRHRIQGNFNWGESVTVSLQTLK